MSEFETGKWADLQTGVDVIKKLSAAAQDMERRVIEDEDTSIEEFSAQLTDILLSTSIVGSLMTGGEKSPPEWLAGIAVEYLRAYESGKGALHFQAYLEQYLGGKNGE